MEESWSRLCNLGSRCTGHAAIADPPHWQGRAPSTEARLGPVRAASTQAPRLGRRRFCTAIWAPRSGAPSRS
eukprot:11791618-Alexandrium_andersonii.AAC.1